MLIKPMAGEGPGTTAIPDDVWISIKNSTGAALSQGYLVCYNVTNNASANGLDVQQPLTSALTAFLGVVDNGSDTNYAIDDTRAGLAKAKGLVDAFLRTESTDGANSNLEGQVFGPDSGFWYAVSNGQSYALGPLILMSRGSVTTFEGRQKLLVRAL